MFAERRHAKSNRQSKTNADENGNNRSTDQLFSEADAKSVELSGYTLGRGAPQTNPWMQQRAIPTGVVDVDESVQLLPPSAKSNQQHIDSKQHTVLQPSENYANEHLHLPPISHNLPYHHQNHINGYFPSSPYYYNYEHLSRPYPNPDEYYSSHHHHHHRHHRHRKHRQEKETYDPRWWYMPLNSVHAPKKWQPPEYHYTPSKWYESSTSQSRALLNTQEFKMPPQKYIDCRCEVCRPSKQSSRRTKWFVNE